MPNNFAHFILFAWPVLAVLAFRKLPFPASLAAALIGGYVLLPTEVRYNLPMLPRLDKDNSAVLGAIALALLASRKAAAQAAAEGTLAFLPGLIPRAPWVRLLLVLVFAATGFATLLNSGALVYGPTVLRGLSPYDALSAVQGALVMLVPFFIARKYFANPRNQLLLLISLAAIAALYTLPTLLEIRISPQLNRMVYGFFPHSWKQHVRGDGYRPVVFLQHGLRLSLFLVLGCLAAVACARLSRGRTRTLFYGTAGLIAAVIALANSLGGLIIAVLCAPVMLLGSARVRILFAAAIAVMVLTYPALRGSGAMPTGQLVAIATDIHPGRGSSLDYRFQNEDILLEKAMQKPLLGWGGHKRNRVFDDTGQDISTVDGTWIGVVGRGGWILYLGVFGLLTVPTILLAARKDVSQMDGTPVAIAVILSANLIDLIPNSGLTPVTWMLAGALVGRLEWEHYYKPAADPAGQPVAGRAAPGPALRPGGLPVGGGALAAAAAPAAQAGQPAISDPHSAQGAPPRSTYAPVLPASSRSSFTSKKVRR